MQMIRVCFFIKWGNFFNDYPQLITIRRYVRNMCIYLYSLTLKLHIS